MSDPENFSEVTGTILDFDLVPKANVYVEAYHVENSILPPYYLGRSALTDQNGKFTIVFPNDAYGVISPELLGLVKSPNIQLKVTDQYSILFETQVRNSVTSTNNDFEIKIPSNFIYSDHLNHVNWTELIEDLLVDMSGMPIEEIAGIIPGFLHSAVELKYALPSSWDFLDYRGVNVPEIPKTMKHNHIIPWYLDWREEEP